MSYVNLKTKITHYNPIPANALENLDTLDAF